MAPSRLWSVYNLPTNSRARGRMPKHGAASFSTSEHLRLRQRPKRGRSLAVPLMGASTTPAERDQGESCSPRSSQQHNLPSQNTETPPSVRLLRPKRATPRGIKAHQLSLYQHDNISYKVGEIQPRESSKEDKKVYTAAAKFFEQGCQLLYSASSLYDHARNDHIPEIIVLGASNAGKSSFLNALVGNMDIARVSQRPGRTQTMNAYGVGPRPKIARELIRKGDMTPKHSLVLVDTPGYGFRSRSEWGSTILKYLDVRIMLRGAVLLIPADKPLQDMDRWMLTKLAHTNTRTLVIVTKADKNGEAWMNVCSSLASTVRREMQSIATRAPSSWWEDSGRAAEIHATAAKMGLAAKLGNGGGLGGVRSAILRMAGFSLEEGVQKRPETASYTGPVISFHDVRWKG